MLFYKDIISGVMLIILYIIGFNSVNKIEYLTSSESLMYEFGPAFFPNILLIFLLISGGILIIKGAYNMIKCKEMNLNISIFAWKKLGKYYYPIILFILSIVVFQKVLPILGFLLTTFLFLCVIVTWFYFIFTNTNIKQFKGNVFKLFIRMIIIYASISLFIYLAFYYIAKIPLPKGILGG